MPVPMRIVAFAVRVTVLIFRHLIAVQAMRCREAVTSVEMSFHSISILSFRPEHKDRE